MSDLGPAGALPTAAPAASPPLPPAVTPAEGGEETAFDPAEARAKARELLFSKEEPEEAAEGEEEPTKPDVPKPKEKEKAPEEPAKDELDISKEYARLDAQKKRLSERQKTHLSEVETFKRESEALTARAAEINGLEKLAKTDPVAFLEKAAGWTKDQVVEWVMSDGKVEPERLIKDLDAKYQSELEKLRKERDDERTAFESEQQSRKLEKLKAELSDEVTALLPKYPTIAAVCDGDAEERASVDKRVRDIIAEVWNKQKKAVDPAEVLEYLESRMARLASRLPGRAPGVKSPNPVAVEPNPITNRSQSERVVQNVEYDELDPEARRARAAAIIRGEVDE